jgi:carbon monoxide dehydrogenase subunit G
MQVTLDKQYPVASGVDAAWAVLSNMPELATCMSGAQIIEEIDATHFKGSVRVKVGPALAAFAGTIEVLSLDPVERKLKMIGKGADKGGSSASMELTATLVPADNGHCTLQGHAEVIVNGKFAQFGGRMMATVSDMILAQFAETFSQKAQFMQGTVAPVGDDANSAPGADSATAPVKSPASAPVVAKELNGLAIMSMLIRNFFTRLFGRQS